MFENGKVALDKEIQEKQQLLAKLQRDTSQLKTELDDKKQQKEVYEKEHLNTNTEVEKLNTIGEVLKSKDKLISTEAKLLIEGINQVSLL